MSLKPDQFLQLRCNPEFGGFFGLKQSKTEQKAGFIWKIICNPGSCETAYCTAPQTVSTDVEGEQAVWQGRE